MADEGNINPGPLDQSKILVEEIENSIKEVVKLFKQLGLDTESRNSLEADYIQRLKEAKGNVLSLNNLNDELNARIASVALNTGEYTSDIVTVGRELDRIVGNISTTNDFSRQILKDFKSLRNIATNIKNDRDLTRVMSVEDLETSREEIGVNQKSLETQVKRAAAEIDFRTVTAAVNAGQSEITNQILEQDSAIREASGRLGGQIAHIKTLRSYKKDINAEYTKGNISEERALEINEQRNSIAEELRKESSSIEDKESNRYKVLESIIIKLQQGEQISLSEHGTIKSTLKAREEGYRKQAAQAIDAAQTTKKSLSSQFKQLDLARSIIEELKTEGKLTDDNRGTIEEKAAILTQNQELLVGLEDRDKARVIKAIEANKALKNNKNLYEILTGEIDKSILREEKLKDTVGLTGAAVKELSKIPVLASVFKAEDVKEVTDEVRRLNKEYEDKASLETAELRNSIAHQLIEAQEITNVLTDDESQKLSEITQKIQEGKELHDDERNLVQDLTEKVLNVTDIETRRKDVLQQISQLSQSDQDDLESVISKVENKKALTEEELRILESKIGTDNKILNINEDIIKNVKEQGAEQKIIPQEVNKSQAAMMMLNKATANFTKLLKDPAALLSAITFSLLRNSTLINDLQRGLGVSYMNAMAMRNEFELAAGASNDLFITSDKLQKSAFALAEVTGVFFDISSQSAETFTNLTERMGLAATEAGNLTMLLRLQGKDTEVTMSNLIGTANAALETSKTTATTKDIIKDIANTSKGLQASFAANPGALAKAAVAARELGATLKEIEGIQKNLLDFESSIGAELEAELLTGRQLNLEKARTAALNNDLEGVSIELSKQGVDLASFGKMNFIQQEKIAAAMGMSRDAMSEMLLTQQTQGMAAEEVRKKFGEQAYEQFKALSAQEKFNAAVEKVKDLFGSVITVLTPIIDIAVAFLQPIAYVAGLLEKLNKATGGFTNGLLAAGIAMKVLGGKFTDVFRPSTYLGFFKTLYSKIATTGTLFSGLGTKISATFSGLKGKITSAFGGASAAAAGGQAAAGAAGAAGKVGAPKDTGAILRLKMKNIARGLKEFADPLVLKGAFNMLLASPGILAFGIAALPLKLIEKINGPKIMASMRGIAQGVTSFAQASAGIVPLLGASAAFAVLGLGLPGLAGIALLGAPAAAGLLALGPAIASLVVAAPGIPILLAIGASLALASAPMFAAAMILEAVANVITSLAGAFVTGIQAISSSIVELANNVSFSQLAGVAGGIALLGSSVAFLGSIFPAILLGSLALGALTLAIIPLSAASEGVSVLADGFIRVAEAIQTLDIGKIALLGISVAALTTSLAGLIALGPIGLTALAVLGGIAAVGVATAGTSTSPPPTQGTETTSSNIKSISIASAVLTIASATLNAQTLSLDKLNEITPITTSVTEPITPEATPVATPTVEPVTPEVAPVATPTVEPVTPEVAPVVAEIVPGISVTTPPPTTTQETPTPNTSTLERVLTLTTDQINVAIGELEFEKKNRSTNLNLIDIMKAQAALVDMRDGQQDIKTELFSNKSLEIVDSLVTASSKITDFTKFIKPKEIGEKILDAEISVTGGLGLKEEKVNLIRAKSPETDASIETPQTTSDENNNSQAFIDNFQPLITETVTSTINALVPPMVAALKEGQGNIRVTNDNFNASSQKELPSQLRNISNSNFA
jgi:biotin operon repressor